MERSMRFWKERKKIRLNGFGKLDGFLGNGIVRCIGLQSSLTVTVQRKRAFDACPEPSRLIAARSTKADGVRSAASHPDKVPAAIPEFI